MDTSRPPPAAAPETGLLISNGAQGGRETPKERAWGRRTVKWLLIVGFGLIVVVVVAFAVGIAVGFHLPEPSGTMDTPAPNSPIEPCPDEWIYEKRSCFLKNTTFVSWRSARDFCSSHSASLLEALNHSDLTLLKYIASEYIIWIGLRKEDGKLQWASGAIHNDSLFNAQGYGDCAYIKPDGFFWADCKTTYMFTCKRKPFLSR